jgi:hypothetical protein
MAGKAMGKGRLLRESEAITRKGRGRSEPDMPERFQQLLSSMFVWRGHRPMGGIFESLRHQVGFICNFVKEFSKNQSTLYNYGKFKIY